MRTSVVRRNIAALAIVSVLFSTGASDRARAQESPTAAVAGAPQPATGPGAKPPRDPRESPVYRSPSELFGKVSSPAGDPVSEADVYLLPNPGGAYLLPVKPLHTRTDAEGDFSFSGLKTGGYQIWAETATSTSLLHKLRGRRVEVSETATENPPLEIPLHPGCGYDVAVYGPSGQPVPQATVSFGWTDIDRRYLTGQDGIARIRNVAMDDWYFVVSADGLATQFHKTSMQSLGSLLALRFDLQPGGMITGVVRDDDGQPVEGARVSVTSATVSMSPGFARLQSDAKGAFTASGLPLNQQVTVSVSKDSFMDVRSTVAITQSEQPTPLELTLSRRPYGGDIRVTVVDAQGRGIENASLVNQGNRSSDVRKATTDAAGEALLQDVFDSYLGYSIVAKAPGYIAQQQSAAAGTVDEPGEIRFQLAEGNLLRGRVVAPDGTPMPKLRVYYDRGEHGDLLGGRVDTDDQGRFEIDGLGPTALITVYTPGQYAPVRQRQVPTGLDPDEWLEVTLEPAGVLLVRAVDELSGHVIEEYNVRIGFCEQTQPGDLQPGGISSSLIHTGVNIQGDTKEYRLDNQLVGAAFKVIVSAQGYETVTVPRMVTQDIATAVAVDVPLGKRRSANYQTVAGRLVDAEGNPIAGAAVRLLVGRAIPGADRQGGQRAGGWRFYHWDLLVRDDIEGRDQCEQLLKTASDEQGRFRFEGVKRDAPWLELFYFGEHIFAQRYSNLRERSDQELQELLLSAERPASLRVLVDLEEYPDADRVYLSAENYVSGINAIKMPFATQGKPVAPEVRFERIPAGTYTIQLQAKPQPLGNGTFQVKAITSQTIAIVPEEPETVAFDRRGF